MYIVRDVPICIHPDYKRQGYGKALLDNTLEKAAGLGFGAVCFEGNIDFYGKADSLSPLAMAYATMVCPREKMPRSFCAKN